MQALRNSVALISIYILANTLVESCNTIDKEALLGFKHRITDDPSALLKTWVANTNCCTSWAGVDCDHSTGRVVNVSMSGLQSRDDFILDTSMKG
ncbi:DNA damage-repair/toleration protein DRT100 [Beta vulgaris subsp. vulgaris]|uniref:DNA damage-repair/toleration protein DRT100 n=1 Tax=Beta vulgaris subsp. vulgaris TaxID=3555 RepID=UPI0020371E76|nr:DNA damage-repair/toleration protein DRT100 [Beta vulgaris subsp. vulgaris]